MPATPIARELGFQPLPAGYFAALVGMVICYLGLMRRFGMFCVTLAAHSNITNRC